MNNKVKTLKVKLSFDVTEDVNRQLETLAVKRNRAKAELMREYIDRGIGVDGLLNGEQQLRKIIRQELDNKLESYLKRIVSISVKGSITSSAAYFLSAMALSSFVRPELQADFNEAVKQAKQLAISYVGLQDDTVDNFLATGLNKMRRNLAKNDEEQR
ncbi:MAG: hypothetical protein RR115_00895 [Hydrogenoanaerobacterium sp.]